MVSEAKNQHDIGEPLHRVMMVTRRVGAHLVGNVLERGGTGW